MKVTYNWLKDFVDIKISAKELADKLTMAGLEVVSLEEKSGDWVFEIEVTSNRPDWLSVAGVAREVAAITNSKLKTKSAKLKLKTKNLSKDDIALKINIQDKNDCPLYTVKLIRGVKVGPSPGWLRERLELVGCRSVNNIVDITNYLLFELGEPMHAFDLDKLEISHKIEINVRRAKAGEKIVTIDGEEKVLSPEILVIADGKNPVAVAGIMGGRGSEVSAGTRNILLEAAVFNPLVVRRGKRALGLDSESAYRFERGVDPAAVENASGAAQGLIEELAGGALVCVAGGGTIRRKIVNIALSGEEVERVLGEKIAPQKIKTIFSSLGFRAKSKGKRNFLLGVPSYRQDVRLAVDLIEEVARIYGFARIPASLPAVAPQLTPEQARSLTAVLKNILTGLGLNEVITYSLVEREAEKLGAENAGAQPIEILNPLSGGQEALRVSLLPGLVKCAAYNLNQKQEYINIFEISRVFSQGDARPQEELSLAVLLCGARAYVSEQGAAREEASPLKLKGILETVFERLGIGGYDFRPRRPDAADILLRGEKIGSLLQIVRQAKTFFAMEVSLEKIFANARLEKHFCPLPKYPGISRDISFVIKEGASLREITEALRAKAGPLLSETRLTDYYQGKQIPEGFRGLTISCLYRSPERTLTEEEVNPLHAEALAALSGRFNAKIR